MKDRIQHEIQEPETFEHQTTVTLPVTVTGQVCPTGWRLLTWAADDRSGAITDAIYEQLEEEITKVIGHPLRPESRKPTE